VHGERSRLLNVAVLSSLVAGTAGVLVDGAWLWLAVGLAAAATALGGFVIFSEHEPRGVPVESLALPVVACVSAAGLGRVAGPTLWIVPAIVAGATLVFLALTVEGRLLGPIGPELPRRAGQVVPLAVLLAFTSFVSVAAAMPGGLRASSGVPLDEGGLVLMAVADAFVAFLLGYRLAALDASSLGRALSAAGTFAAIIGVSAALTRAWSLPRLLGPAVLAAVFYLWSAYRAASAAERRSSHWIWEYVALAGAAAIAVAWNLLLR
jgi:hypothetical protein